MSEACHTCCKSCPTERDAVVTRRVREAEIAIVVDFPTEREAKRDQFLDGGKGSAAQLVLSVLDQIGIDQENVYVCSAVNCRPNPTKQAMLKNAMKACRTRLVQELKEAGVKKVLCMGTLGFSALMSSDKNLPITKVRGRWRQAFGMNVMGTIAPGLVIVEPGFFRDFIVDVEKFFDTDEAMPDPEVDIWIPDTLKEAEEAFRFIEQHDWHSIDLETSGLSPIDDYITAAGFGVITDRETHAGTTVVIPEDMLQKKKTWRWIAKLLNGPQETVLHNGKFDLKFLRTYFEDNELPYKPRNNHDTLLLHYTLDERGGGGESQDGKTSTNKFKCHGLETLARCRYDAPDYGINMKKFLQEWETANEYDRNQMRKRLHVYLGLDCYYTARLFPDLWNDALEEDENLIQVYENLLIPGQLALVDAEYHGVMIDQKLYKETRTKLQRKANRILKRIRKTISDAGFPDEEFNPKSAKQVQQLLYKNLKIPEALVDEEGNKFYVKRGSAGGEGSSSAHVLRALTHRHPEHKQLLEDIMEYRNITKNIGTYLTGLLDKLDSDGRLRGNFNLHGTETGRLSSSGPNLQNIPDTDHTGINVRGGFVAPEGYKLIEADYSQLEVRIAAELSGDPVMKEVFDSGRDVHSEISQLMYQMPPEEIDSYMRMLGKNILFGLLYGRGAESVALGPEQEQVALKRGEKWSVEEVTEFFDNLLGEWQVYAEWQQQQKLRGYRDGYVQLPSGRRRRFPFISSRDGGSVARASFNTPIQGTASDFTLYAVIQMHRLLPPEAHVILTIHDSIMVECPAELAEDVADQMEHIMMNETLFRTKVPLKVKTKISERWDWKQTTSRGTKSTRSVLK